MKTCFSFLVLAGLALQGFSKGTPETVKDKTVVTVTATPSPQKQVQKINLYDKKKRRHGDWEFYWDDSVTVANKGEFRHGEQIGTWYFYNQDGSLQKIETKKFLGRKYKTQLFYPNGKLQKEGYARVAKTKEYVSYYWYGNWKCYDENGNYVKTEKYKEGELVEQ